MKDWNDFSREYTKRKARKLEAKIDPLPLPRRRLVPSDLNGYSPSDFTLFLHPTGSLRIQRHPEGVGSSTIFVTSCSV